MRAAAIELFMSEAESSRLIQSICVFCGSSPGLIPDYIEAARQLGRFVAEKQVTMVYGGSRVGLMGAAADAALDAGGRVVGVIPEALVAKEVAHTRLTHLRVVASMHERKALMAELADAFVALPGGCGTLEEFFEVLTWGQLGLHHKPCALLNISGYFDHLLALLDHAVAQRFVHPLHREMIIVARDGRELLDALRRYAPPDVPKWIDREET